MPKYFYPEKGKFEIQGHEITYEMTRSQEPSIFGIQGSRIFELNMYRDGTMTVDYNKKWIKVPYGEDEISHLALQHLIEQFGQAKAKKEKKKNGSENR